MKTKYRILCPVPDQYYVQELVGFWIFRSWRQVRPCFFVERDAKEYLDKLVEKKYPRVVREVTIHE